MLLFVINAKKGRLLVGILAPKVTWLLTYFTGLRHQKTVRFRVPVWIGLCKSVFLQVMRSNHVLDVGMYLLAIGSGPPRTHKRMGLGISL